MFTSLLALFMLSLSVVQAGSTASMRRSVWLSAHNRNREKYDAPALDYAPSSLTKSAQTWANKCVFKHSGGSYGENIAYYASSPAPSVDFKKHAMQPWMSEASTFGGHFTQVVWKSTDMVACAAATCPKGTISQYDAIFYVCQYTPAGNVQGEYDENVEGYSSRSKRSFKRDGEEWGISAKA